MIILKNIPWKHLELDLWQIGKTWNGFLYNISIFVDKRSVYNNKSAAKHNFTAYEVWLEKDMNFENFEEFILTELSVLNSDKSSSAALILENLELSWLYF